MSDPEWKEISPEKELAFHQAKLDAWDKAYHDDDQEKVPDHIYNVTRERVRELKELLGVTIPEPVGGRAGKVTHSSPMLSIKDVFNIEELKKWFVGVMKVLKEPFTYTVEYKNDGLAISLTYRIGKLVRAVTRGDGTAGEDVTERFIQLCPGWVTTDVFQNGEIRGEGIVTTVAFNKLNASLAETGLDLYSTQRHLAAAQLRGSGEYLEGFQFIPYDLISDDAQIGNVGDPASPFTVAGKLLSLEKSSSYEHPTPLLLAQGHYNGEISSTILELMDKVSSTRRELPHLLDGLVFKVNKLGGQALLGLAASHPKWAVAFKFPPEGAWSVLRAVVWQVGKHGTLTPVAEMDPVTVGGVEITNPTLHNWGEIQRLGVKIGSKIYIERRGDVIPKITYAEPGSGVTDIDYPERCPCCDNLTVENGAYIECPNPRCSDKVLARLMDAVSEKGLDIRGLGPVWIRNLMEEIGICHVSEFFKLTLEDLSEKAGLGDVRAKSIMEYLDLCRLGVPFHRAIYALGWLGVGVITAKKIAQQYGTVDKYCTDSANSGVRKHNLETLAQVVNILPETKPLDVKGSVCITGSFEEHRDVVKNSWEEAGYKVTANVSKNTTILLVGKQPTPHKLAAANKLGIIKLTSNVGIYSTVTKALGDIIPLTGKHLEVGLF